MLIRTNYPEVGAVTQLRKLTDDELTTMYLESKPPARNMDPDRLAAWRYVMDFYAGTKHLTKPQPVRPL